MGSKHSYHLDFKNFSTVVRTTVHFVAEYASLVMNKYCQFCCKPYDFLVAKLYLSFQIFAFSILVNSI